MHVALLANTAWLDEQLVSFQQLVVGLIDESVRVAQVVPQYLPMEESIVFGERVLWQESTWPWVNLCRVWRLDTALEPMNIDLLHALDGRLWPGAALLARRMSLPVLFHANSHLDLRRVERVARLLPPGQLAFSAATAPIAQAMAERLDPAYTVEHVAQGAHAGEPVRARTADDPVCVVISGNGRLDHRYEALLDGIAQVIRRHAHAQFFFDGQGSNQHQIWRAARQRNLLANLSLIPRRLGHRELLVRADVLVHPQPLGLSRALTLQAMAHAVPVLAHQDPWLDYLLPDETGRVVQSPTGHDWEQLLCDVIERPREARELGERAQAWARANRPASQHIGKTLELYQRLAGHSIPFPDAGAA